MPVDAYAAQSDLELAVGGAGVLRELCDFDQTGSLASASCQAAIQDYLETGAARVRAAVEVKHEPETVAALDAPSRRLLVALNVALSARVAWVKGGRGQAVPDVVNAEAERAERDLDRIAEGHLRLGRSAGGKSASINQPAVVVADTSTTGVAAFRRSGFR